MVRVVGGIGLAACAALMLLVSPARAQDQLLEEVYGQGVHAYFAGKYAEAYDVLSVAINGGSKDPRVYYFRALADAKLGHDSLAESDMKTGAQLETEDTEQLYPVSRSLERVQGHVRLTLERHRMVARAETRERQEKLNALRYEQQRRSEESVRRAPVAPAPGPEPSTPGAPAAKGPTADDPFSGSQEKAGGDAAAAGDGSDPFGEAPVTPEKKGDGEAAEMPAEGEAPAGKADAADSSDAFGGGDAGEPKEPEAAGAKAKPEEGAAESEMPAEQPAEGAAAPEPKSGGGDDPFGDAAAPSAKTAPAKAAPAKVAPKAGATPKPPKAGDAGDANPFGDDKDQSGAPKAKPAKPAKPTDDSKNPFG